MIAAVVLAHEIAHSIGMEHSYSQYDCSTRFGKCIMNPDAIEYWPAFYPPSFRVNSIITVENKNKQCLHTKKYNNLYKKCGDGVLDDDETCDCGSSDTCKLMKQDKCCDMKTCTFFPNIKCKTGECCENCNIKPEKALPNVWDLKECATYEKCDGNSAIGKYSMDTTNGIRCRFNQNGYCHNGKCIELNEYCKT
nr:reprolysin-like protein [Ceratonova shasta]